MKTAVVTDSNCGISRKESEELGIFTVPMPICIDDMIYHEGEDLDHEDFLEQLASHGKIHTSQPSPAELMAVWEKVLEEGYDDLVYIPMSSGLSGSFHTACLTAEKFSGKVFVADARRISVTLRHAVLDARWLSAKGVAAADIRDRLGENARNAFILVGVNELDYLKRGGRITPAAAAMASVLNIKPLLSIGGNRIDAYEKVRGQKSCERKLVKAIQKKASQLKAQGYAVRIGIAGSFLKSSDTEEWYGLAKESFPDAELIYDPLTCSISTHTGPNAFGMGISAKITSV